MLPKERNTKWMIAAGVLLLAVLAGLSQTAWLDPIEHLSLDIRFILRGIRPFPEQVVVVGIDEASLDALGRWPWPRSRHNDFLYSINRPFSRPAVATYDILFEQPDLKSPESDAAFAKHAASFGKNLILAYFFEKGSALSVETNAEKEKILEQFALPRSGKYPKNLETMDKVSLLYDELLGSGTLGFANNSVDRDGRTRRKQLLAQYRGRVYPSLVLLSAMKFLGAELEDIELQERAVIIKKSRFGKRIIPITPTGDMFINYWGGFQSIPEFSFVELLREAQAWMMDQKEPTKLKSLKDKLIVIGATALGLEDRCVTPFHENDPATSIQAQALANIIENVFLKQIPEPISLMILILLGLLILILTATQKAVRAFAFTFLIVVVYLGIVHLAFLNNYWLKIAWPLVTVAVLFVAMVCLRYFLTAEELKRTYAQLIRAEKWPLSERFRPRLPTNTAISWPPFPWRPTAV